MAAGTNGMEAEKRIKAIRKKLQQIEKLKAKSGPYTPEEQQKIASEQAFLKEVECLERGEMPPMSAAAGELPDAKVLEAEEPPAAPEPPAAQAEPAPPAPVELSPAEAEKRVRALKKKLGQIEKLKEKEGQLTKEEDDKLKSEPSMLKEVLDLEIGLLEPPQKQRAQDLSLELDRAEKLRAKGAPYTPQEKDLLGKEKAIRAQLEKLFAARAPPPAAAAPRTTPPKAAKAKAAPPTAKAASPKAAPRPSPPTPKQSPKAAPGQLEPWIAAAIEEAEGLEDGFVEAKASKKKNKSEAKRAAQSEAAPVAAVAEASGYAAPPPVATVPAAAPAAPVKKAAPAVAIPVLSAEDRRMKTLQKKLNAIEHLKSKSGDLTKEEIDKIGLESIIREEIQAIRNGEVWPPISMEAAGPVVAALESPGAAEAEPSSPPDSQTPPASPPEIAPEPAAPEPVLTKAEAEKRIKALNKKIAQVDRLKARAGQPPYTEEELSKMAQESGMQSEIARLQDML